MNNEEEKYFTNKYGDGWKHYWKNWDEFAKDGNKSLEKEARKKLEGIISRMKKRQKQSGLGKPLKDFLPRLKSPDTQERKDRRWINKMRKAKLEYERNQITGKD